MVTKTASKEAEKKPSSANNEKKSSNAEEKCICQICTCG